MSESKLSAAVNSLKANGVDVVKSESAVDPIAELETIAGVDSAKLTTFKTDATAAVEAAAAPAPENHADILEEEQDGPQVSPDGAPFSPSPGGSAMPLINDLPALLARAAELEAGAMERVTAVDLPRESGIVSGVLDDEGAFGFFGTYTSPGVIARVELHAGREPRPAGRIELNPGEDNLYVALRDGAYAYFGTCVGEGTVLVKVHLPTFQRVSTIHLAGVGYLSAGTLELPGPGAAAATAVLATFTRPANLVRLELSPAWSAERHDVTATKLSLGEGNDDAYAVAALPGMVAVVLSASPGRLAFAPLPKLDEIRLLPLPGGQVGRGLAAISDRELLLGSYGGAPGLLARVTVDGSCDQGGCICSGAEKDLVGSGAACSQIGRASCRERV